MTKTQIVLAIVFNALWIIPMIVELIILPVLGFIELQKKNKEFIAKHGRKKRLQCLKCKYCVSFVHHPFYKYGPRGNFMTQRLPKYCKRFKKQLNPNYQLVCDARDLSQIFYVEE